MKKLLDIASRIVGLRGPSPLFTKLTAFALRFWNFALTTPGRLLVGALLLSGAIGSVSISMPVYHLFFALAGAAGSALVFGFIARPRGVQMDARIPQNFTAGEEATLHFTLLNNGRLPVFDVLPAAPNAPSSILFGDIAPLALLRRGENKPVEFTVNPQRRGLFGPVRFRAFSTFPFNLFFVAGGKRHTSSFLVYPAFHPLLSINLSVGRRFQPGGIALTSNTGESPEYTGNREYRYGDPISRIDFRAWARLAAPAVREYQEEYFCRVALVLDTFVPGQPKTDPEGHRELEAAISLCAATADVLARGEYIIDLFAAGPELYVFRAGRRTAHFENVLEILACLDPCTEDPFDTVTPPLLDELATITTLICVFLDWDETRAELVRAAKESGCAVKLIVVRDSPTSMPLEEEDMAQYSSEEITSGRMEIL